MVAIKTLVLLCVCLFVAIGSTNAFHSRYFDSYEDDWPVPKVRRLLRRPLVVPAPVSRSVEAPVEDEEPVRPLLRPAPASVEVSAEDPRYYSRPSYGRRSYYEPRPSYGYRPRYGKK